MGHSVKPFIRTPSDVITAWIKHTTKRLSEITGKQLSETTGKQLSETTGKQLSETTGKQLS